MKKILFLFVIQLAAFLYNTAFSQDTTKQDALDFIKTNLNQSSKATNTAGSSSFYEIFNTENDVNYNYSGQYTDTVISAHNCIITFVETLSGNTKISFIEDNESPDEALIYSNFGYLSQDTITIDFSKISRIESGRSSITFTTYNNMDLIKHNGQITQTPSPKRKNDLVRFFKEDEDDLYRKLKKFFKKNNINYDVSPNKVERYNYSTNKFTINNIDRDKCRRLVKAFEFLQQNCGVPKEKF